MPVRTRKTRLNGCKKRTGHKQTTLRLGRAHAKDCKVNARPRTKDNKENTFQPCMETNRLGQEGSGHNKRVTSIGTKRRNTT